MAMDDETGWSLPRGLSASLAVARVEHGALQKSPSGAGCESHGERRAEGGARHESREGPPGSVSRKPFFFVGSLLVWSLQWLRA